MGRLFWIQLVSSQGTLTREANLVEQSVHQRARTITLDEGRGNFFDRNHKKLTGNIIYSLAIFPLKESDQIDHKNLQRLVHILGTSLEKWHHNLKELKQPRLWNYSSNAEPIQLSQSQISAIEDLKLPGVYVVPYRMRYDKPYLFAHLIGYVGQNPQLVHEQYQARLNSGQMTEESMVGAAGLEKSLDPLLQSLGKTKLSLFTDGNGIPIAGLNARLQRPSNSFYPVKVDTTLDQNIQMKIESIIDEKKMKQGAVVVLDASNADVMAMASRPQFDPHHIVLTQGNWSNKGLKATSPGSIFKTVIAAAALEEGWVQPNEVFYCDGSLGKYHFSCWKKEGHGRITFEQAFAQSCNITFAKIVERLSSDLIEYYAKGLGLIQQVGWSADRSIWGEALVQFDSEEKGTVFSPKTLKNDGGVRAQTAIGQRDVAITPLQAANLIVTLLHGGEVRNPRVVHEIRYQNDGLMYSFDRKTMISKRSRVISKRTSNILLSWMEKVVNEGTGQSLKQAKWQLAGKSGTAQVKLNGIESINQWFIGYGPTHKPLYAVAVLVQTDTHESMHQATEIFREIMDQLQTL